MWIEDMCSLYSMTLRDTKTLSDQYKQLRYGTTCAIEPGIGSESQLIHHHTMVLMKVSQRPVSIEHGLCVFIYQSECIICMNCCNLCDNSMDHLTKLLESYYRNTTSPHFVFITSSTHNEYTTSVIDKLKFTIGMTQVSLLIIGYVKGGNNIAKNKYTIYKNIFLEEEAPFRLQVVNQNHAYKVSGFPKHPGKIFTHTVQYYVTLLNRILSSKMLK